jgi:predicted metal-dependent peptidase
MARDVARGASPVPGSARGDVARILAELTTPRNDWRGQLTRYMTAASDARGHDDTTFTRRHRQADTHAEWGITLPAAQATEARIAVIVDTSGSMDDSAITLALSHVRAITLAVGVPIQLYSCDTSAEALGDVDSDDVATRASALQGGGGTDMRVGIERALRAPERPNAVIVITDGYTPWPDVAPPVPIIVACTTDTACPHYAHVVRVGDI